MIFFCFVCLLHHSPNARAAVIEILKPEHLALIFNQCANKTYKLELLHTQCVQVIMQRFFVQLLLTSPSQVRSHNGQDASESQSQVLISTIKGIYTLMVLNLLQLSCKDGVVWQTQVKHDEIIRHMFSV